MIDEGLVEEVRSLLPYRDCQALQTVGYKEIFEYLDKRFLWRKLSASSRGTLVITPKSSLPGGAVTLPSVGLTSTNSRRMNKMGNGNEKGAQRVATQGVWGERSPLPHRGCHEVTRGKKGRDLPF